MSTIDHIRSEIERSQEKFKNSDPETRNTEKHRKRIETMRNLIKSIKDSNTRRNKAIANKATTPDSQLPSQKARTGGGMVMNKNAGELSHVKKHEPGPVHTFKPLKQYGKFTKAMRITDKNKNAQAESVEVSNVEQIDEISSDMVKKARDSAFAKGKDDQAFRFVKKAYEKGKKESDAIGKKMAEDVAANNVGGGAIAGTQGDAGKKVVMTKEPLKRKKLQDFKEYVDLEEKGLWDNIHAKRKRIKAGSGERMRKPGEKGAPTAADFKSASESVEENYVSHAQRKAVWATRKDGGKGHPDNKKKNESVEEQFDMIEDVIQQLALKNKVNAEQIWEDLETIEDDELLEYAIDKKGHKSSEGGLTQKGVDYYNRKTGGNLKTAVTTPPSKLDPDSKAAKRRKSFCARMGGMKKRLTSAKTANDPDSRINKALRKWNC